MSGYIGVEPIPKVTQVLTEGTLAAPSQTINVPGGYTVGNIAVYINGFRLKNGTYSAPDGMVVNLLEEFPAGTEYIIEEFRQFLSAYHYTKVETDLILGDIEAILDEILGV